LRRQATGNGPEKAFAAKLFWLGESVAIDGVAAGFARVRRARDMSAARARIQHCTTKSRISSALLQRVQIYVRVCAAKKFVGARFRESRAAFALRRWGAGLTHKIKRSHCYFFPAVVIG
jgi:hypothetical protein